MAKLLLKSALFAITAAFAIPAIAADDINSANQAQAQDQASSQIASADADTSKHHHHHHHHHHHKNGDKTANPKSSDASDSNQSNHSASSDASDSNQNNNQHTASNDMTSDAAKPSTGD